MDSSGEAPKAPRFGSASRSRASAAYTPRGADRHVFSMRKANEREQARIAPLLEV
jgi:uncharacterized DUF497 family protein